jgi:hypothetical protein
MLSAACCIHGFALAVHDGPDAGKYLYSLGHLLCPYAKAAARHNHRLCSH